MYLMIIAVPPARGPQAMDRCDSTEWVALPRPQDCSQFSGARQFDAGGLTRIARSIIPMYRPHTQRRVRWANFSERISFMSDPARISADSSLSFDVI